MRLDAHTVAAQRVGQRLAPAQHGLLLGDVVRRVHQGKAGGQSLAHLVVLHVPGHEHIGDLAHTGGDGRAARAGQHGDAPHQAGAVAGVAQRRLAQHGRDLGGERRQRHGGRQHAEAPEAEAGQDVVHGDDVEGGLLVGVRGHVGRLHAAPQAPREHDLQAQFLRGLVPTHFADRGARALGGQEAPLPARRPRAVLVLPDHAGARREQRLAHQVGVVRRHEADQLEPVDRGGLQRLRALETEHGGHHVGQAALRLVKVGVRNDDGQAVARGAQRKTARCRVLGEALERREDERVVRQHQPAAEPRRLVEGAVVGLQGDEHAVHVRAGGADLQADVVPRLRQIEGRQPVDDVQDVANDHAGDSTARGRLGP